MQSGNGSVWEQAEQQSSLGLRVRDLMPCKERRAVDVAGPARGIQDWTKGSRKGGSNPSESPARKPGGGVLQYYVVYYVVAY